MKLVSAHYIPEESKVLFFFTAENRVDFRELVKDLVSVFKMRIELRQIGVRDESRVLGGLGVCGRSFCCHGITDKLRPVSIKMAKEQNLSLNSMKISGPCGRLLCCLAYEYDLYKEAKKDLPSVGNRVCYQGVQCKITDVNILTRNIKIVDNDGRYIDMPISVFEYNPDERIWNVKDNSEKCIDASEKK
jgi:cell fate regulator YaaT (PSP1 superfamily)